MTVIKPSPPRDTCGFRLARGRGEAGSISSVVLISAMGTGSAGTNRWFAAFQRVEMGSGHCHCSGRCRCGVA